MKKARNLHDLSEITGCSTTSISMTLNGKGDEYGIAKKTQQKIIAAAANHQYNKRSAAVLGKTKYEEMKAAIKKALTITDLWFADCKPVREIKEEFERLVK